MYVSYIELVLIATEFTKCFSSFYGEIVTGIHINMNVSGKTLGAIFASALVLSGAK